MVCPSIDWMEIPWLPAGRLLLDCWVVEKLDVFHNSDVLGKVEIGDRNVLDPDGSPWFIMNVVRYDRRKINNEKIIWTLETRD